MQIFLFVSCIFAIAVAAPEAYHYGSVGSSSDFQQQYAIGDSSDGSQYFDGGAIGDSHAFDSFNPAPALPLASSVASIYRDQPQHQRLVLPPIISKHVFYHSAPEEPDEEIHEDSSSEQERKHYNVVFIKVPHQSVRTIATQTAQALNQEKTAIYVLNKKNDISEVRQALVDIPHHPTKPEVFFVKYKTPEEAHHAQQTIQSQYDSLGGSTHVSDEGYAPVSSVVGTFGGGLAGHGVFSGNVEHDGQISGSIGGGSFNSGSGNFIGSSSNNAGSAATPYLPPNRF